MSAKVSKKWEYPRKRILVDFDGTIMPFSWGPADALKPPYPEAVKALKKLKSAGYDIVIFSGRCWPGWADIDGEESFQRDLDEMSEYIRRYKIPCVVVTHEKVPCMYIIDDRSLQPGTWRMPENSLETLDPNMSGWWRWIADEIINSQQYDTYGSTRRPDGEKA